MHSMQIAILFYRFRPTVRPSVCHVVELYLNEYTYRLFYHLVGGTNLVFPKKFLSEGVKYYLVEKICDFRLSQQRCEIGP